MREMIINGLQQTYESVVRAVGEFLPRIVVMLIIILLGWVIAFVLKHLLRALLRLAKFDRLFEEAGASQVLRRAALPTMSELLSRCAFWVAWLGFVMLGIGVLGIAGFQEHIARFFLFLPQIFVALLILLVGMLAANFFSRATLLAAVNAGYPSARLISAAIRLAIGTMACAMALEQIGLAKQTVLTGFAIVFGAALLGLAIAFGMGGRDLARQFLEKRFLEEQKEKEDEMSPL